MKRIFQSKPGKNCLRNPCGKNGCGTDPSRNHGVVHENWRFVVTDGRMALSLNVASDVWPEGSVSTWPPDYFPSGSDLSVHASFPPGREYVLGEPQKCEYLDGGRCYISHSSGSEAHEFVKARQAACREKSESFWLALEARFAELTKGIKPAPYTKCVACDGTGTVHT